MTARKTWLQEGFTLLELLIALMIFLLVLSSVYGAYRTSFSIIENSSFYLNSADMARTTLETITDDLSALLLGEDTLLEGSSTTLSGLDASSLKFLSTNNLRLEESSPRKLVQISYLPQYNEETELLDIYRVESTRLPNQSEATDEQKKLLCTNIKMILFTFRDREGNEAKEWETVPSETTTDSDTYQDLPAIIEISLQLSTPDKDRVEEIYFQTALQVTIQ